MDTRLLMAVCIVATLAVAGMASAQCEPECDRTDLESPGAAADAPAPDWVDDLWAFLFVTAGMVGVARRFVV